MTGSKKTSSGDGSGQDHADSNVDLGAAAAEANEQIQDQVSGLTQQVRQQATDQLTSQKERLVDTLDTVALLLHQAGEHADLQDKAMLSGYVDKASTQLGTWSEGLREKDVTQLLEDTVQFARRQPMIFFSGALAVGFAGARFLRSSTQQPETTSETTPGTPATVTESGPADVAHYDSDQAAFDAALANGATSADADITALGDWQPESSDFVEDYKAATLEGDELIDASLAGTSNSTSTEQR